VTAHLVVNGNIPNEFTHDSFKIEYQKDYWKFSNTAIIINADFV
jgi:hypothetical protein